MICKDCATAADCASGRRPQPPGATRQRIRVNETQGHKRCAKRGTGCTCQHRDSSKVTESRK